MIAESDCMIKYHVAKTSYLEDKQKNGEFDPWVQRLRGMIEAYEEVMGIEPKTV